MTGPAADTGEQDMATKPGGLRPGEEEALQGLLREMAPEAEPAPEVRERIRAAVAAEWRTAVAAATPVQQRWRRPTLALAAGLVVGAIALGVLRQAPPPTAPVAATLVRFSGPVEAGDSGNWQPAAAGQSLAVGEHVVTGPRGKVALALGRGATLRLDTDTRIAFASIDRVIVERGAVYFDAGATPSPGPAIRIDTAFGSTRHLGTQYEVRMLPATMQVSVREGRAAMTTAAAPEPIVARAGEQVAVGTDGAVTRGTIDRRDPRWNWITDVTPPFAIEDRRLAEFLAWVCRETGRELAFASPAAEAAAAAAAAIVLRGSVAGLSPDEALAAVVGTTNLTYREEGGRLIVQSTQRQAATQ